MITKSKVTIRDVAKEAGVSPATVSGGRSGNGFFADHDAIGCNNKPTAFDEYRLYDRVLSKEEIKTIYDAEKK